MRYSFRIAPDGAATESPPQWATRAKLAAKASAWAAMSFEDKVETFSRSKSNIRRRAAETIREMLAKGIYRFHRSEWVGYMGVPKENADDACDVMAERGIIRNVTPEQRTALYEFCLQEEAADPAPSTDLTETLRALAADPLSSSFQRIGQFLLKLIDNGREHFAPKEWGETFDVSKTTYCTDVRRAMNMGLIQKMRDGHGRCIYRLNRDGKAERAVRKAVSCGADATLRLSDHRQRAGRAVARARPGDLPRDHTFAVGCRRRTDAVSDHFSDTANP